MGPEHHRPGVTHVTDLGTFTTTLILGGDRWPIPSLRVCLTPPLRVRLTSFGRRVEVHLHPGSDYSAVAEEFGSQAEKVGIPRESAIAGFHQTLELQTNRAAKGGFQ